MDQHSRDQPFSGKFAHRAAYFLAAVACDPCGPPAEPLISVHVELDAQVQPEPTDRLHLQMLNGESEEVTQYVKPISAIDRFPFETQVGACDGWPQETGVFTIRAWLSDQIYSTSDPAVEDPQGLDQVDVSCTEAKGCVAARRVAITIALPQPAAGAQFPSHCGQG